MDERVAQYFRLDSWLFWTIVKGRETVRLSAGRSGSNCQTASEMWWNVPFSRIPLRASLPNFEVEFLFFLLFFLLFFSLQNPGKSCLKTISHSLFFSLLCLSSGRISEFFLFVFKISPCRALIRCQKFCSGCQKTKLLKFCFLRFFYILLFLGTVTIPCKGGSL